MKTKGICDLCGEEAMLEEMQYEDTDSLMLCQQCVDREEMQADYNYERQKEEGIFEEDKNRNPQDYQPRHPDNN